MTSIVSTIVRRATLPLTVTGASIALSYTWPAQAATFKYNLSFETTAQSIWAPGNGVSFTDNRFLGVSWDKSFQQSILPEKTLIPSITLIPEITTPEIPPQLITPEIPPQLITPEIPRKLISREIPPKLIPGTGIPRKLISREIPPKLISPAIPARKIPGTDPAYVGVGRWKTCINPIGCGGPYYTPAIPAKYSPRIPAVYSPAIPAKYSPRIPAVYSPAIPAVYSPRIPAVYSPAIPAIKTPAVKSPEFKSPSVGIEASTAAKAGLESKLKIEGGTVNSFIPINLFLEIPDGKVRPGEEITIKSGFSVADGAHFSTASPIASYILDLVFGLNAKSGFQVGENGIPIFDFNIPETRTNFLSLTPQKAVFEVPLGDVGTLSTKVPIVNTKGFLDSSNKLVAEGRDSFVQGSLDLDALISKLYPALPPLENTFETEIIPKPNLSVPGFSTDDILRKLGISDLDLSARAKYNLLDMTLGANLSLSQSFSLLAESLTGKLIFKNGSQIPFKVGQDITITVPDLSSVEEVFNIDAIVDLNTVFSNKTSLGFDINLAVLAGLFEIDPPFNLSKFKFDPLFKENLELFKGDLALLYNKSFNLTGFSSQNFSLGIPVASGLPSVSTPISTPIPGPISTPIPGPISTPIPGPISTPIPGPISTPIPGPISTSNSTSKEVPEPGAISTILLIGFIISRYGKQGQ